MKKIYYTILGWFASEMALISKHSANALSSFEDTLNSLKEVEARILKATSKKEAKAEQLAKEVALLASTKAKNARIATKIQEFLND